MSLKPVIAGPISVEEPSGGSGLFVEVDSGTKLIPGNGTTTIGPYDIPAGGLGVIITPIDLSAGGTASWGHVDEVCWRYLNNGDGAGKIRIQLESQSGDRNVNFLIYKKA